MAIQTDIIGPLGTAFTQAQDIFVLLPQNAGSEMVSASLGLYHALRSAGKTVTIACPTPLSQTAKTLPGGQDIVSKIGNRNLIISLKVDKRDSIDKVSYSLDESAKIFNLVVQPKKGEPPLKKDAVQFSYSGAQADLVFMVGANRFEDLGVFYQAEKSLFTDAKTVVISRFNSVPFADFHIQDPRTTSLSELTLDLINTLNLSLNQDAATSLLLGIDSATQNLQSPTVSADTFEKVAKLMRAGGTRRLGETPVPAANGQPVVVSPQPVNPAAPQPVPQEWLTPKVYKASPTA